MVKVNEVEVGLADGVFMKSKPRDNVLADLGMMTEALTVDFVSSPLN